MFALIFTLFFFQSNISAWKTFLQNLTTPSPSGECKDLNNITENNFIYHVCYIYMFVSFVFVWFILCHNYPFFCFVGWRFVSLYRFWKCLIYMSYAAEVLKKYLVHCLWYEILKTVVFLQVKTIVMLKEI